LHYAISLKLSNFKSEFSHGCATYWRLPGKPGYLRGDDGLVFNRRTPHDTEKAGQENLMTSVSSVTSASTTAASLPPAPTKSGYLITAKPLPPVAKPTVVTSSAASVPPAIAALSVRDSTSTTPTSPTAASDAYASTASDNAKADSISM
jgi:hypothetical protein